MFGASFGARGSRVSLGIVSGIGAYAAGVLLLRVDEAHQIGRLLGGRLRRA